MIQTARWVLKHFFTNYYSCPVSTMSRNCFLRVVNAHYFAGSLHPICDKQALEKDGFSACGRIYVKLYITHSRLLRESAT